ncbi:MAG: hypothetical protein C4315_04705, partial [Chloroflexota bacterium]
MFPAAFEYVAPTNLDQALSILSSYGPDAKILAGGQSLIPAMRFRLISPKVLVDINRVGGLNFLEESDGWLRLGALVRHRDLEVSELIRSRYPLLADTAAVVADPIVRNLGTVAGSL